MLSVFFILRNTFGYIPLIFFWCFCQSINGTYSYLVKIPIEKLVICIISDAKYIECVSISFSNSDSLNPKLSEISVLFEYANQVSSYFLSVVISIFGHLFRPFCFEKYTQNAIKTFFEGLQGTYQEKCWHTQKMPKPLTFVLLNKQGITLCKKKKKNPHKLLGTLSSHVLLIF